MIHALHREHRTCKAKRPKTKRRSRLLLEGLEDRRLMSGDPFYSQLQDLQSQEMAIVAEHGTVDVGTFNPSGSIFAGLGGGYTEPPDDSWDPQAGPIMKPHPRPHYDFPDSIYLNALNAGLQFSVADSLGDFSVTVNGVTTTAAPGQDTINVEVGTASAIQYTVTSGWESYTGSFTINRPPRIGVATIPIIPISVVYDVPQSSAGQNLAEFTQTQTRSTTVSLSFSQENSTTTPTDVSGGLNTLKSVSDFVGNASKVIPSKSDAAPVAEEVSGVLSVLSSALGTVDQTHTNGTDVGTASTNGWTITSTDDVTPWTHLGPGEGDVIHFYQNVPIVIAGWDGHAISAPLNFGVPWSLSVHFLKERLQSLGPSDAPDPVTGLDRTTIQALLALDPLSTGGPNADLDPSRFADMGEAGGLNGVRWNYTFSTTLTASQQNSSVQTTMDIQTDKPGFLSWLGIGVTDDNSTKVTVTDSHTTTNSASETVTSEVTLYAGADEFYRVHGYFDSVLGSMLIRKVDPGAGDSAPPPVDSTVDPISLNVLPAIDRATKPGTTKVAEQSSASSAGLSQPAQSFTPDHDLAYAVALADLAVRKPGFARGGMLKRPALLEV